MPDYKLIITNHARERWVERVVNPERYAHLSVCKEKGCKTCVSLVNDINCVLRTVHHEINKSIVRLYYKSQDKKIMDHSFLEAIKKKYGNEPLIFLDCGNCIFVVQVETADRSILRTVLKRDMLEGTIFRNLGKEELDDVFERWKFEARQKR